MESITLPAQPRSLALARSFLRDVAGQLEGIEEAVLMTSELVANVVQHARTDDLTLCVGLGPPLRVEVRDGVAATVAFRSLIRTHPPSASPTSVGGRGLGIVHTLSSRMGLDAAPSGGKVVWFEL